MSLQYDFWHLMGAAVTKSNIAGVFMEVVGPLDVVCQCQFDLPRENPIVGGEVTIPGQKGHRFRFLGVQADKITDIAILKSREVLATFALAIRGTSKNLRLVQFI